MEENNIDVEVEILKSGEPVQGSLLCSEVLDDVENLSLRIGKKNYRILTQQSWVSEISLPAQIFVNLPIYPTFSLYSVRRNQCKYTWYRSKHPEEGKCRLMEVFDEDWDVVSHDYVYQPTSYDVGHRLKFVCDPQNTEFKIIGKIIECYSKGLVQLGGGAHCIERRLKQTSTNLSGKKFRVCSYNILADLNCYEDYAYCLPEVLCIDYRKQLIVKELMGYKSDITCLQEVDKLIFDGDLIPVLNTAGYEGKFVNNGGRAKGREEGLAIFYKENRFKYMEKHSIVLADQIKLLNIFKKLWDKIKVNEQLVLRLCRLATTLQVLILQSIENPLELLVIANTDLYSAKDAAHIRLLQSGFIMTFLVDVIGKLKKRCPKKHVSLIFCGDFNSEPHEGVHKLMTKHYAPDKLDDWMSNSKEFVKGLGLWQPISLASAYGSPRFTRIRKESSACVDYIYYQRDTLKLKQIIYFPSDEEIKKHTALPSVEFPSDHLALIADFEFI